MANNVKKIWIQAVKDFGKEDEICLFGIITQFVASRMAMMQQPIGNRESSMNKICTKQINLQDCHMPYGRLIAVNSLAKVVTTDIEIRDFVGRSKKCQRRQPLCFLKMLVFKQDHFWTKSF